MTLGMYDKMSCNPQVANYFKFQIIQNQNNHYNSSEESCHLMMSTVMMLLV